jgi:hypothetical protein
LLGGLHHGLTQPSPASAAEHTGHRRGAQNPHVTTPGKGAVGNPETLPLLPGVTGYVLGRPVAQGGRDLPAVFGGGVKIYPGYVKTCEKHTVGFPKFPEGLTYEFLEIFQMFRY